ncbi:HAD family hydrolase [Marinobacter bryozoorum]|uniref:HAD family hydrolase n=1 Tax=Marinobacter bryozoorum TaxID=256324 RepID=UPI0020059078|nr:HAD family hydrolase [Marinobacter bryozoorum]MCK7543573.1 HAD family hydrolase [Marinobacter bryozoorum]
MTKGYLFDWGNTLMVDFPHSCGKMCDWTKVQAVEGAEQVLAYLSRNASIYVATGAADSTVGDIEKAFRRVGLDRYISGYFCQSNIGQPKGSPEFLIEILHRLGLTPQDTAMVGDNFDKDIAPALAAGIKPFG